MKALLQILRGLTIGLPAALCALARWFCALLRRELRPGAEQCDKLGGPIVRVPDPTIYDQYYLMSLGLPVTWDNPDITIWLNGAPVAPSDLQPATAYLVCARVWNNSLDAPVAGLNVAFSYLSFGIATQSHPIGQTQINLGVKGGPDQPAFALMSWTTPATPGHYCIQARLEPASDTNWNNNLGQENTQVVVAQSPAISSFALRNDTDEHQLYEFRVDSYRIGDPPPCPPPGAEWAPPPNLPARLASLAEQGSLAVTPLPPGWQVTFLPAHPELAPSEQIAVQAAIEPPAGFSGTQPVNIHAFRISKDRRGARAVLAGGVTFTVSVS